jgi:NAD+ synthase (glutamine-hydrolysing)
VALCQIDPVVGDLVGNARLIAEAAGNAAGLGARLIVLPEMALTGYPIEDLALRSSFQQAAAQQLQDLAGDLVTAGAGACAVIVGSLGTAQATPSSTGSSVAGRDLVVRAGAENVETLPAEPPAGGQSADRLGEATKPTNIAAVLRHGRIEAVYTKHLLPNYGVFDERRLFARGVGPLVIDVDGTRVGLAICHDIWEDVPDSPVTQLLAAGERIDLLAVLNGSPFEVSKAPQRRTLAAARAVQLGAPVAYCNLVGGQDDLVFDGGSFVTGPDGAVVAGAAHFHPETLIWDADDDGRPAPLPDDDEAVYRAIVLGLRDYAVKNGFKGAILGLSGGIDSALTAAIATDALGRGHVTGVSMPSAYSSDHSKDDAADVAERCGIDYRVVPIGPMVDAYEAQLHLSGVAAENIQARVRGQILMAISNMEGQLVLATGNKSELATGYSTIYGDAVGGFAPIKDVLKTRVWAISRWRNAYAEQCGETPPIPENSITKPPSAELRPGQLDSDTLPDYHLLDKVLDQYVEHGTSRQALLAAGHPAEAVDRALRLTDRAEWKRRQYPLGPKVTALAFGRDRRLPVTNRWVEP